MTDICLNTILLTVRWREHLDFRSTAVARWPRDEQSIELARPKTGPRARAGRDVCESAILDGRGRIEHVNIPLPANDDDPPPQFLGVEEASLGGRPVLRVMGPLAASPSKLPRLSATGPETHARLRCSRRCAPLASPSRTDCRANQPNIERASQ